MVHWPVLYHGCMWIKQFVNLFNSWHSDTHISCWMMYNTYSTKNINSSFPCLPWKTVGEKAKRRGWNNICMQYYTKASPWLCLSGDCWRKMDSEIQCRLWSLNVMNPKYPHIFPDTLSLSCSGPASRPYVLGFTLPKPLACLLQTTTSYHRTPAAERGPEARPLVYPTLMALFSNSEPFAVEPRTLQESNLTWRPGAHSHRELEQVKSPQHLSL